MALALPVFGAGVDDVATATDRNVRRPGPVSLALPLGHRWSVRGPAEPWGLERRLLFRDSEYVRSVSDKQHAVGDDWGAIDRVTHIHF